MKLVCAMSVRDELGRYLRQSITHALTYCDEVRVIDNGSTDGGLEWLARQDRVALESFDGPGWADTEGHEGRVHQAVLDWAMEAVPTHVLLLDADELVPEGARLRGMIERAPDAEVWALTVLEVWGVEPWRIRVDGEWGPRSAPMVFRTPPGSEWHAFDMRLAAPRWPLEISEIFYTPRCTDAGIDLLHLGWANPAERVARAERYTTLDGGDFHAREHIDSILWPAERVKLQPYGKPAPCLP